MMIVCVCVYVRAHNLFLSPLTLLPYSAAELYSSVLSEGIVDWGSMGPGEEWVNSATHEGEQGKTQLSQLKTLIHNESHIAENYCCTL